MRVRSGGSSACAANLRECHAYWGIDPMGSFFVLTSGFGDQAAFAGRCVCENVIHALLPHREQIENMASDSRPDSRKKLMDALCYAMTSAEQRLLESLKNLNNAPLQATCDLIFLANGIAYMTHIGNGRIYLLRGDTGRQLTIDHTADEMARAQFRPVKDQNDAPYDAIPVRTLGSGENAQIDTLQVDLKQGDRLVMCNAGACQYFQNPTHLAQLYRTMDPQRGSEYLAQYAIDHGCVSCASVVCIEISDPGMRNGSLETDSRITALEQICFFRGLSYQEMLQIMPITFERVVDAGIQIIHEGDVGEELYILVEGKCEVSNRGVRIAMLDPGCSFGELSLVDRQPRSASVRAVEKTRVLVIRAVDFERMTLSGALAIKLLWNVTHELSERIRKSSETIRTQGAKLLQQGIQ